MMTVKLELAICLTLEEKIMMMNVIIKGKEGHYKMTNETNNNTRLLMEQSITQ